MPIDAPPFLYGTAWKEEATERYVELALQAGFRGIDTANQRKHYHEAGVGAALARAGIPRHDLFLQTKFTYVEGQDSRLPFDPTKPFSVQVRQSFARSLEHLGVEWIDSLVLHGPRTRRGLTGGDQQTWQTMEQLADEGKVRFLGISNVTAEQVETLCRFARIQPAFVQNRCYARLGWDRETRDACARHAVRYQGFSLLTANRLEIESRTIGTIARRHGRTSAQVIFRFAIQIGMICLTGTTNPLHMSEDLDALDFELTKDEVATIERISG